MDNFKAEEDSINAVEEEDTKEVEVDVVMEVSAEVT